MARREDLTPRIGRDGAWGRFRAHLSAASTRRFHQISFPGEWLMVRPTGIEPVSVWWRRTALPLSYGRVHRAGLEPAKPKGTWFTARPRCRLSICAFDGAGDHMIARTCIGGR